MRGFVASEFEEFIAGMSILISRETQKTEDAADNQLINVSVARG